MIRITRHFCLHESGTKFYQTLVIHRAGGQSVAINDWGSYRGTPFPYVAKVKDIFKGASGAANSHCEAKRDAKRRRGYANWQEQIEDLDDLDELSRALPNIVRDNNTAIEIVQFLAEGDAITKPSAFAMPEPSEPVRPASSTVRNDDPMWGSW